MATSFSDFFFGSFQVHSTEGASFFSVINLLNRHKFEEKCYCHLGRKVKKSACFLLLLLYCIFFPCCDSIADKLRLLTAAKANPKELDLEEETEKKRKHSGSEQVTDKKLGLEDESLIKSKQSKSDADDKNVKVKRKSAIEAGSTIVNEIEDTNTDHSSKMNDAYTAVSSEKG